MVFVLLIVFFFVKQKTSYEMRISDWSSDVCSSDLRVTTVVEPEFGVGGRQALVKLRLRSGRVLRHRQEEPKGEPTSPLSTVELEAKFFATAGMVLDRTQAERLDRAVMAIDTEADVGTIPRLAVAPGEKPVLRAA